MYYQYEVTFPLYAMSPGEKIVFNAIVVIILTFLALGMFVYLPQLVIKTAQRLFWLHTGSDDQLTVGKMTAAWSEVGPEFGL